MAKSFFAAGVNRELFRALSHPLRNRILVLLSEGESSPSKTAARLGEPLGEVAGHFRALKKMDLIVLVETRPGKRGSTERIYKSTARPVIDLDSWETLSKLVRETNSVFVGQAILGDLAAAMQAGTFDRRTNRTMIRYPLSLDEEGAREIEPASASFLEALDAAQSNSDDRREMSGEAAVPFVAVVLAFETPGPSC